MKYCYFKTRNRRGFTLVELMVVLAVTAILAALAGGGLIAYIRLARFQKNESNARAMFQTAQLAVTQLDMAGEKDDFTALVVGQGHGGHITQRLNDTMTKEEYDALNARVYALYFDKGAEPAQGTPEAKLYAYIKQYVYDSSFLDAAFCIEIDAGTGQVFSVFYDAGAQALRFDNDKAGTNNAVRLDNRSYQNRRDQTLVGYYCAEDAVNVVNLQQSKLRVRNQRLINGETLDLSWGGTSKSNETDTQYTVDIYSKTTGETTDKKLFSVLVKLPAVTETQMELPVTLYDDDGNVKSEDKYTFPLRYANGSFVLTLDAMNDAAILQVNSENPNSDIDKTQFFSITRFVKDATDIYAKITAAPRAESVTSYTVSEAATTNTENSLYAEGGTTVKLQCFRHLYNLRWYTGGETLTATLTKDIDWLSGAPVVYCVDGTKTAAKTPAANAPVAWPSLLELKKNVTLDGSDNTITGLQLRGNSVAKDGCRYIGLVAENSGTIQKLTLADPDVLVNLTADPTAGASSYTVGGETLSLMAADAEGYRGHVRAVGALCGVSTGTVKNCTVERSKNRTATARVAASLTFDDTTTTYTREKDAGGNINQEPLGIGGLVGSAVPGEDKTLQNLTADKNVTVAGIWQDGGAKAATETTEQNRLTTTNVIDRAIGVGGVFGVLSLQQDCKVDTFNNAAEVYGNACTGGIAGNISGKSGTQPTLNNLNNTGSVHALAGYNGYTAGQSLVLGQFFGGVAGRMQNATLQKSYSSTRSSLSENDVKTMIKGGYNTDGTLTAASPLQGDFVGGLVGFGEAVQISDCRTGSGYVLGNTFVGGMVGGLSRGTVWSDSSTNSSHVFGHRYVGGVVSFNDEDSTITGMRNTGMTAAFGEDAAYAGGIVGYNAGILTDCTEAASTNTATNASRVQLLRAMAKGYYADFVGGVAGCNAGTIKWTQPAAVSVLLDGGSFVGGVVGFNDSVAQITVPDSAALTVSGRIVGEQDAVGGLAGLNCANNNLPAVTVKAELIFGRYCVGGVLGANVVTNTMTATRLCTDGSGNSLQAEALAGGIVGYNRVIAAMPDEQQNVFTRARSLLPTVAVENDRATVTPGAGAAAGTAVVTLENSSNTANVTADAYVGGVVGYNDNETKLTVVSAKNGAANSVSKGILRSSGTLLAQPAANTVGNMAGGIIGYAGANTTLQNCQNFAGVFHKQMAGGIAGYNAGTIENCTQNANLGTRQTGYTYIGGIAGINAGTIHASAPGGVTISGGQFVGGVAGLNAQNSKIEQITNCTVTVQGSEAVGGLAGKNYGTVGTVTALTAKVSASGNHAGGAVGQNSGTVKNVNVTGGSVQGSEAVGGLAGKNSGHVDFCTTAGTLTVRANQNAGAAVGNNEKDGSVSAGSYAGKVYAAFNYAGGIAGQNAGVIENNAAVSATVTCEKGNAGGVAALNNGTISAVQVNGCTVKSGSAYMGAVAAVNEGKIQGVTVKSAALQGGATVVGGIAGVNKGTIGGDNETDRCTVAEDALTLNLTAADITLGGAAGQNGQNEENATINKVQVALDVTENLAKYHTLGGVAGENNGTLQNCVFTAGQLGTDITGTVPATKGAAKVGDAIGGVAGVNKGTVTGCTVQKIRINMLGITNVEASQDVATKLDNASHVGGIVGRNTGTIQNSVIGTVDGSAVIAKYGFVGGIAGSNAGEISGCGGNGTAAAVNKIKDWLRTDDVDTMITRLKYSQKEDGKYETDSLDGSFNALRGVDAIRAGSYATVYTDGLAQNQLTVALRGSATNRNEKAAGYLGGVTGYNTDTGVLCNTATGKWFVYCDNGDVDNAVIGGMIGQNESDKDMTNLLNCAAVRRFSRTENSANGNDDTQNRSNQHIANANVGGVIGVQQNRSGDRWSLTNVVNYGTVHNSRSNCMAGIISLWLDNGGTLEHCFNFGALYSNANGGWDKGSGMAGGIVAQFNRPVSGGTTNLISCQNQGDIWSENCYTANDVGGILGAIRMKNSSDYLIVNITDCVVGDVQMKADSQIAGVIAWLDYAGSTYVHIDRCRNYCTTLAVHNNLVNGSGRKIGISGDRDNRSPDNGGVTTITNCFVLYDTTEDKYQYAIAFDRNRGNIKTDTLLPNFYMDTYSFAQESKDDRVKGLENLSEVLGSTSQISTDATDYPLTQGDDNSGIFGYRLYAGKNNTTGKYFAAQIPASSPADMNENTTFLREIYPENSKIATDPQTQIQTIEGKDGSTKGKLMFTFTEQDKNGSPSKKDINDAVVRSYYTEVLDAEHNMANDTVTNIKAVRSDDTTNSSTPIYGRYRITWDAVPGASHYKVTVKVQGEDGENTEMSATVYTNQYTFEAPEEWKGKKYIVEVTPCNSKEGKATTSETFTFAQTLPTPQMEIRVFDERVELYVKNIDAYNDAGIEGKWYITPSFTAGWNWSPQADVYDNVHFQQQGSNKGYIGKFTRPGAHKFSLRASAKTEQSSDEWMQSAQYNVQTYIPNENFGGLGTLNMTEPILTGTTADELTITTDLSISGQEVNPKYRIMLQGKYRKNDITVNGKNLNGQYVTLQAVEKVLSGSATRVTFSNLPDADLTDFTDLRILAAPVNTGMGDAVCRWEFRAGVDNDKNPVEYVREVAEDGTVSYVRYAFASLWCLTQTDETNYYLCTKTEDVPLTVVEAPNLNELADYTLPDNNLLYTFTWNNVDGASDYTYKLYGITDDNNEVEINLKDAATLATDGTKSTLTVAVDQLANGAADWHFKTVRLAVTSVPEGSNAVGATASRTYTVRTRLTQPGAPNSIRLTNSADAETLPYEITWAGIADSALDHYELLAEYKDNGEWKTAETWPGKKDASLTVNLEKYQGKTLRLRVVAVPGGDDTVLRSPYSAYSTEFTVVEREAAPTVNNVEFTNKTPTQDVFLNSLQVQFTVPGASSHYVTGYLFKKQDDYNTVVGLVDAWKVANANDKATALQALQDKLAELLQDGTQAVCLIPQGSRTTGLPAETTDDGIVRYTLTPEKFAMQPKYGDWYLLPAVRTMTTEDNKACSVWTYYIPTATALQVPCIKLETPLAVRGISPYTGDASISDAPNVTTDTNVKVKVQRIAVQWSADNLYPAADTMLANTYEVTVTPTSTEDKPYTLRITVQPKDVYELDENGNNKQDENGNLIVETPRGTVLTVEKSVNGGAYFEIPSANGSWDVSVTQETDTNGNPVLDSHPTTLTGKILQEGNLLRYYTMQVHPTLQYEAETKTYRLILPDLAAVVYADPTDPTGNQLTPYTATVEITAKGENVQDSTTATIDPHGTN